MKRIFLIWPTDISKQSALYPPLGLASLASVLKQKNYQVKVIDLSFDEKWEQIRSLKEEGGIYGISFTSSLYNNAKKCVRIIRENDKNSKIVLGGPHASLLPEETLEDMGADIACIGEAEVTFPLVVETLQKGADLRSIKGIAFRDEDNKIVVNPEMEKIKDLDSFPFPDQSLFPYEKYFKEKGFRELSIITSRGCPGQCTFCQPTIEKMFGRKIRFSGSDYVVDQIRYLKEKFKLDFFVISDDTFITKKKRVLELCEKIVSEKINIFWRCQTRISLLDREIIRVMKRAGCFVIALGVGLIPGYARMMASQVLVAKETDYVMAEHSMGATNARILIRHIVPNCFSPILVMITLMMGTTILAEAGLSFIGIGITPPIPAWGSMVTDGRNYLLSNPMLSIAPGVAIMLLVFSFNMVGDGLRDALDPRLRGII